MKRLVDTDSTNWALLIARLAIAIVIFPHGAQKMFGWFGGGGFDSTLQTFSSMGLPWIISLLVIIIETIAPILLAIGAYARLAALSIFINFIGVTFVAVKYMNAGFFMNWYQAENTPEGIEFYILLFALTLVTMAGGAGALSVDSQLSKKEKSYFS